MTTFSIHNCRIVVLPEARLCLTPSQKISIGPAEKAISYVLNNTQPSPFYKFYGLGVICNGLVCENCKFNEYSFQKLRKFPSRFLRHSYIFFVKFASFVNFVFLLKTFPKPYIAIFPSVSQIFSIKVVFTFFKWHNFVK